MNNQTEHDKQQLAHLQVTKLIDEIDKLFKGYKFNVIMPALMSCLKRIYDAEQKLPFNSRVFYFYLNQSFSLGWFGNPSDQGPKLIVPCKVEECPNPVEANGLCKEHLADGSPRGA